MSEVVTGGLIEEHSVGFLMNRAVLRVSEQSTVKTAMETVQSSVQAVSSISYVYVVDRQGCLVGVCSIGELMKAHPEELITQVMQVDVISTTVDVDREVVAHLAVDKSIKAIPVVDEEQKLIGVISTDAIFKTLREETTEDFIRFAGISTEVPHIHSLLESTAVTQIKQRLPWLLIGLAGGIGAAVLVSGFEEVLDAHVAIAAFIPLVVYLADAIGSQIQIIFIRTLTLYPQLNVWGYFVKEVGVNITVGTVLAALLALISFVWLGDGWLSISLGLSVFATAITALCVAILLPWTLYIHDKDPAIASGPLATVIIDLVSLLIYFLVVSLLLL